MVDAVRTLAALQALLADNTTEDISPQDVRDFLVSVYGSQIGATHNTPPTTGWSWVNQGSFTETTAADGSLVYDAPAGAGGLHLRARAHASSNIHTTHINGVYFGGNGGFGLAFRESSTSKITAMYVKPFTNTVLLENWTNETTFSASLLSFTLDGSGGTDWWFQVEDNGTNLVYRLSTSGYAGSFVEVHSMGRTSFMAGGPNQVGILFRDNAASKPVVYSFVTT